MKKRLICVALLLSLGLVGCASKTSFDNAIQKEENNEENELTQNDAQEELTESIELSPSDDTIIGQSLSVFLDRSSVELSDFSLLEEGYATSIKSQENGTCWAFASSTSMESSYKKKHGDDIEIDPMSIVESVYGEEPTEGYYIKVQEAKYDYGGWAWQVIEKTANGFEDYVLIDASNYENTDIDTMKAAIAENGAMNVAVNDAKSHKFGNFDEYYTLNDPDSDDFDHEVVLIGWDDNFPKENFRQEANSNGAWLAQNSRGDKWGRDGYYWISYDTPFIENTVFQIEKDYGKVIAYDGGNENRISTGDVTQTANIFHDKGKLKAVGTYTVAPSQKIVIDICDADLNNILYRKEATFEIPGYHTIELDEPLDVENYAIAVSYEGEAPVEGESWEDSIVGYSVDINPNCSIVKLGNEWVDMSDADISTKLGIDFIPNNCCIKAIYEVE